MPEIRRTITNTFKDAQECEMFIIILKQKWSEFDGKLSDKFTVEIATDVADPCRHTAYLTAQSVEDFKIVDEWAKREVIPLRDCLGPLKLCHYLLTKGVTENGTETVFG